MKVYDHGSTYRVSVSANEVYEWKRRWPNSGLRDRGYWFVFEKRNGDRVDTNVGEADDGADALALSEDARAYGRKTLRARGQNIDGCTPC